MRKITPYLILGLCCVAFYPRPAAALNFSAPKPKFGYRDASGKRQSIEVVDKYYPKKIVHLFGNDSNIDPKLRRLRPSQRNALALILFRSAGTTSKKPSWPRVWCSRDHKRAWQNK